MPLSHDDQLADVRQTGDTRQLANAHQTGNTDQIGNTRQLADAPQLADSARQLVLVGMMGSGKTRVGRHAAMLLGREFVDLDQLVERRSGQSVTEIFKRQGEAAFRSLEHEALRQALADSQPSVIATGGGVVLQAANRELLAGSAARVVWLQASAAALAKRLARSANQRPLLAGAQDELELQAVLSRLLAEREAMYDAVAHCRLLSDELDVADTAREVAQLAQAEPEPVASLAS